MIKHDDEFRKSKLTALWFCSVLLVIIISYMISNDWAKGIFNDKSTFPTLGIDLNAGVTVSAFLIASIYTSTSFYFHSRRSLKANSQYFYKNQDTQQNIYQNAVERLNRLVSEIEQKDFTDHFRELRDFEQKLSTKFDLPRHELSKISIRLSPVDSRNHRFQDSSEKAEIREVISSIHILFDEVKGSFSSLHSSLLNQLNECLNDIHNIKKNINLLSNEISVFQNFEKDIKILSNEHSMSERVEWHLIDVTLPLTYMAAAITFSAVAIVLSLI